MQFCILLAVVVSLIASDQAPPGQPDFARHKLVAAILLQMMAVTLACAATVRTKMELCQAIPVEEVRHRLTRRCAIHLCVWLLASLCIISLCEWPRFVNTIPISRFPLVEPGMVLLPIFAPLLISWTVFHAAESSLENIPRSQSRWQYAASRARFFLLLPILPVLLVVGWCDCFDYVWREYTEETWAPLVRVTPLLLIVLAFPLLLRSAWHTRSLGIGPLRDRLEARCSELNFEKRDILVWRTRHQMLNAAVAGLVPKLRYVLLTDKLIRDLPESQVELVFMHEVAHAKLRHHAKLLLAFTATFAAAALVAAPLHQRLLSSGLGIASSLGLLILISTVFIGMHLSGRYVRLLELQADLWVVSQGEDAERYLRTIASVAGGDPDRVTWLHPSFQQRCDFLLQDARLATAWLRTRLSWAVATQVAWLIGVSLVAAILRDLR